MRPVIQSRRALKLTLDFFGLKAIAVGCIPIVFWLLKLRRQVQIALSDIRLLVLSYGIVAAIVFLWKWFEAGKLIAEEDELKTELESLDAQEQAALKALALKGGHGSGSGAAFDSVCRKTRFVDRDFTGWVIVAEHREFLRKWARARS